MKKYLTVLNDSTAEYIEKRSRFIATVHHCETEEEAMSFLDDVRAKYWDAKHNVYAYSICGGTLTRFSDDSEPHGTAGKPVFDVITGNSLTDVIIVVTRYFGGVLLGTGGLVHAYSKSAADAVNSSVIYEMVDSVEVETVCDYTDHGKLVNLITRFKGQITDTQFTTVVTLHYAFRVEEFDRFSKQLNESFSARVTANIIKNTKIPFVFEKSFKI